MDFYSPTPIQVNNKATTIKVICVLNLSTLYFTTRTKRLKTHGWTKSLCFFMILGSERSSSELHHEAGDISGKWPPGDNNRAEHRVKEHRARVTVMVNASQTRNQCRDHQCLHKKKKKKIQVPRLFTGFCVWAWHLPSAEPSFVTKRAPTVK